MDARISLGVALSVVISIAGAAISWGALDTRVSSLEQYRVKAEAKQDVNESRTQEILTKLTAIETQLRIFLPQPGTYGRPSHR